MLPFHRWEQLHTTGTPPLGVSGYATCHIEKDIFYFAGYSEHESCYHNSLFSLCTETLVWNELFPTSQTSGPMRKADTALLSFDGQLLTVAGRGPKAPTNPSPLAKYSNNNVWVYTNEHHFFNRNQGEHVFWVTWYIHVHVINKASTALKHRYFYLHAIFILRSSLFKCRVFSASLAKHIPSHTVHIL